MSEQSTRTHFIKRESAQLGFSSCRIARAERLDEEANQLEAWLKQGQHGKMAYMERHFDKRVDPTQLVPGAQSVVSLLYNYYPEQALPQAESTPKLSKYAYGEDYHTVVREKLNVLMARIRQKMGQVGGRAFVDSAPTLERAWASKSGLGWIGKNSLLIHRQMGSFFFLAELILDVKLDYDTPIGSYCGSCTACIDACPTQAIVAPYVVDASRCISYFTIELKEAIPSEMQGKFDNWVFGCDVCQDVCPWNRFATPTAEPRFAPNDALRAMRPQDWEELNTAAFEQVFGKSAVQRAGLKGLQRNVVFLKPKVLQEG